MTNWTIHWLEAAGSLAPWKAPFTDAFERARQAVSRVVEPPAIDIIVMRDVNVIREIGELGTAFGPHVVSILFDPENENFEYRLNSGGTTRTMIHEAHHCLRMAGPGYGLTLAEALVSEGMAGQFVRHLLDTPPEPWERAVSPDDLRAHLPNDEALAARPFDRDTWFFGKAGTRPWWYGYTLGYEIVGEWADATGATGAADWIETAAEDIMAAGLPRLKERWSR